MLNFWALKISRKENKFAGWFLIAELAGRDLRDLGNLWALSGIFRLFWIVKTNAHLNQATQKNTCQILLRKKIPESKISNQRKSFDHPCHLKSGVPHPWGFNGRFGLKTDILTLPISFEETMGVYEHIYHFSSKWIRKKEKYANLK